MSKLGNNFYPKLVQIASEVGMKPEDILAVMISESGLNPSAHEKVYNGGGLVGFMPATLKGLKFKGSPEDFRKLSGEEQLNWVKKLIQGYASINGGPLTSAGQYYVANFFPIALKLPGIRSADPSTIFVEERPAAIKDPKAKKVWSKKYNDIGIHLSTYVEKSAYTANPLFHGNVSGAITFGDMLRQVERNRANPLYKQALKDMQKSTDYIPDEKNKSKSLSVPIENKPKPLSAPVESQPKSIVKEHMAKDDDELNMHLDEHLSNMDKMFNPDLLNKPVAQIGSIIDNINLAAHDTSRSYKKLFNKFLPNNKILIKVYAHDNNNGIEFSRILCSALDEELMARAFTYTNGKNIEIECDISGSQYNCLNAVKELTASIQDSFKDATKNIGGIDIMTNCFINKKSSYKHLDLKSAEINYRMFLLKFK